MAQSLITDDVRRGIRQLRELEDRFLNGSVDPRTVRRRLQDLIEGNVGYGRTPEWYVEPETQRLLVETWLKDLGITGFDIPAYPSFTPRTETEVLMLCIYLPDEDGVSGLQRTVSELGRFIGFHSPTTLLVPVGISPETYQRVRRYQPGVRWVAVDLEAHAGASVSNLVYRRRVTDLADVEVIMAACLFSEWISHWSGVNDTMGEPLPRPALGNLVYTYGDGDDAVPVFEIDGHHDKEDRLTLRLWMDHASKPTVCVPTVRELS